MSFKLFFLKIDLRSGYYQIMIKIEDIQNLHLVLGVEIMTI